MINPIPLYSDMWSDLQNQNFKKKNQTLFCSQRKLSIFTIEKTVKKKYSRT